jgi:hypothetical protein
MNMLLKRYGHVWMPVFAWACLHGCSLVMFGGLVGELGQATTMQDSSGSQARRVLVGVC